MKAAAAAIETLDPADRRLRSGALRRSPRRQNRRNRPEDVE
jgi:hypothetical protein